MYCSMLQAEKRRLGGARQIAEHQLKERSDAARCPQAAATRGLPCPKPKTSSPKATASKHAKPRSKPNRLVARSDAAAVMAAHGYHRSRANRITRPRVLQAWSVHRIPRSCRAFAWIQPDETPKERLKRF